MESVLHVHVMLGQHVMVGQHEAGKRVAGAHPRCPPTAKSCENMAGCGTVARQLQRSVPATLGGRCLCNSHCVSTAAARACFTLQALLARALQ